MAGMPTPPVARSSFRVVRSAWLATRYPSSMFLVCYNPIAGRGKAKAVAEAIAQRRPDARLESRIAHAVEPAAWEEAEAVLAVGGDGTLRTVVSALLKALPGELPPVGVVPLGTANLMAQHTGMVPPGLFRPRPLDWLSWLTPLREVSPWLDRWSRSGIEQRAEVAVGALERRRLKLLDIGTTDHGLMLLMAGVGLDGHVIHALQAARQGPIRKVDYLPAAAAALLRYDFPALRVTVDGRPIAPPTRGLAFCANVEEYGTGFPLLPGARSGDGRLDACLLPAESVLDLVKLTALAVHGEHHLSERAVRASGKEIRIESDRPAPVQIDGEAAGKTPATMTLAPRKLRMLLGG